MSILDYKSLTEKEIREIFAGVDAVYEGDHFVYTKGGHGNAYVNKDDIYKDPDVLSILAKEIAYRVRSLKIDAVAGATFGGALLANWVAYWLRRFDDNQLIVAVAVDGEKENRIIKRGYGKHVRGKRVLITEDVINTGATSEGTVKAVAVEEGNVVALMALCNRADDKEAVAKKIGVNNQGALLEVTFDNFSMNECPYCTVERPINQDLGHGRSFLEELVKTSPGKASRLGWKG